MKKLTLVVLAFASLLVTGCTSYHGISKADKSGTYYITTNKRIIGVTPGVELCKADKNGDLTCRSVNVD